MIAKIAQAVPLDIKYQDHALSGKLKGYRECHLAFDVLLVYRILKKEGVVILEDIDSHDRAFRKQ